MNDLQSFTAGLQCALSELQIRNIQNSAETPLETTDPFQLSLKVTFSDTSDGHLMSLLMPLGLAIRVSFSARSYSCPGPELDLGHVTLTTTAEVFEYIPTLVISGGAAAIGLDNNAVYQIKAVARVGHAPFSIPSLGRGFINGLDLSVGEPEGLASEPEDLDPEPEPTKTAQPTAAAKTRTSRSRTTKV
jgi:hypothetical protein